MNKYEELFNEILSQTKSGKLNWRQVRKESNSELIFNSSLIWRQFTADLVRGNNNFTLLFVEKKYEDPAYDFTYEKYLPELLIIHEGELIATLSDSVIDISDMIALANIVETTSDKAKLLFG
jgi:hypothetical protein